MENHADGAIAALYRHPVKGFSPEGIDLAALEAGGHFPGDRLFAFENGASGFDPAAPEHMPKQRFLMLMRHERLARLRTAFDDATRILAIKQGDAVAASGCVDDEADRATLCRFLTTYMGDDLRGELRLLAAPEAFRFMDSRSGFVSLLNLASVAGIARLAGRDAIDPLRFRANLHVSGWQPWAEHALEGARLAIGEAEFSVIKRIDRCAAVDVAPGTGLRDLKLVPLLERALGHHDCGIYLRITRGGIIRRGDVVTRIP